MTALLRTALIVLVASAVAATAFSQPLQRARAQRRERTVDRGRELIDQARQIRRVRSVTRRVLRDQRASPAMKQQATELAALLERREEMLAGLKAVHSEFLATHKAEIEELEAVRNRVRELSERLESARKMTLDASAGDISELKRTSKQAAETADALRASYFQERRDRRQR
jgi:triphosphoribosyl-dephospho-CoA synthetase